MQKKSRQLALCGSMAALALTIMLLGGLIPVATFCCPMLCALLMLPVLRVCGTRLALAWYAAVAILSCLLGPDKEAAFIYVFLGWYPAVKPRLDRCGRPVRWIAKFAIFHVSIGAAYALLLFVLRAEALREEFLTMEVAMLVVTLLLGNLAFFLFDALLPRMERWFARLKWLTFPIFML